MLLGEEGCFFFGVRERGCFFVFCFFFGEGEGRGGGVFWGGRRGSGWLVSGRGWFWEGVFFFFGGGKWL